MHSQNTKTVIKAQKLKIYVYDHINNKSNQAMYNSNLTISEEQEDQQPQSQNPLIIHNEIKPTIHELEEYSWTTVQQLKQKIAQKAKIKRNLIKLFYKTIEMTQNNATLDSFVPSTRMLIQMYESKAYDDIGDIRPYNIFGKRLYNRNFQQLGKRSDLKILNEKLIEINSGFQFNIKPQLTDDGTSGAYFLCNKDKNKIAVFKPQDEEAYAPNNPRGGLCGEMGQLGIRNGIYSGESAVREVAAYLLDFYSQGRHGVPITTFVEFFHPYFSDKSDQVQCSCKSQQMGHSSHQKNCPKKKFAKYGSLQLFEKHQGVVGDYGSSLFPIDEIHKIAILDIRILNCDRNDENILIEKIDKSSQRYKIDKLIPIDHGLSLPDTLQINDDEIVWMGWDEVKKPLSKENKEFILNMNIDDQVKLLRSNLKVREKSLRLFKVVNILLKRCVERDYTLYDIGNIIYRQDAPYNSDDDDDDDILDKLPSKLEKVLELAENFYESNKIPKNDFKKVISDVNHNNNYEARLGKLASKQTDSEEEEISTTETNRNLQLKNNNKFPNLNNKISEDPENENLEEEEEEQKINNNKNDNQNSKNNGKNNLNVELNNQKKENSDKEKYKQIVELKKVKRSNSQPNMCKYIQKTKKETSPKHQENSNIKQELNDSQKNGQSRNQTQNQNQSENQINESQSKNNINQDKNINEDINQQNQNQNLNQNLNQNNQNENPQRKTTLYNRGTKNFNSQALKMKKNEEDDFRDEKYYECFENALKILIFKEAIQNNTSREKEKERSSPRKRFMSEQIDL